jgi:hypothetical protein
MGTANGFWKGRLPLILNALYGIALLAAVARTGLGQPGYQIQAVYDRPKPRVAQPTERVAPLIASLWNDSLETRRAAREALLAMGPEIQPQLQWALEKERRMLSTDDLRPAGRSYTIVELTVLIDHLEQLRHSTASMINLHFANAPLIEILRSLGSQIDARVSVSNRGQSLLATGAHPAAPLARSVLPKTCIGVGKFQCSCRHRRRTAASQQSRDNSESPLDRRA